MMEREYIQKLLDSYMAAETTKEEEHLLSDYFSTHRDIPAEWQDFSVLFRGIRQYEQKPYGSYRRTIMKWSAAACLLAIVGVGITLLFNRQETTIQPIAQQQDKPMSAVSDEAPCIANVQNVQNPTARKTKHVPRKVAKRQKPPSEKNDTLGDGIWKQKENVVLALQMLAECEAAAEQIQRNNIVEAAFLSTIKPHPLQLVVSESGDYMVVDDSQPTIIEL
ncbi:MAG: hypothetical protein IJ647_08335 [Prevotella sp.]|nr:hypothetical protein [Prevotella sp.]